MMRRAALLASCCASLLPQGSALHSDVYDFGALVQNMVADYAEERGHIEQAHRMKQRMLVAVKLMLMSPESLSNIVFAKGDGEKPALAGESSDSAGCSQEDKGKFTTAMTGYMDKVMDAVAQAMEDMEATGAMGGSGGMRTMFWADQRQLPMGGMLPGFDLKSLGLPKSCENFADSKGSFITCVHQATNVSKTCVRCVPQFLDRIQSGCSENCEMAMARAAMGIQDVMTDEMMRSPMGPNVERLNRNLNEALNKHMKGVASCVHCAKPRVDKFADCLGANDIKTELMSAMDQLEEELKSGGMQVHVSDGPPSQQSGQPQPAQKMLFNAV